MGFELYLNISKLVFGQALTFDLICAVGRDHQVHVVGMVFILVQPSID